MEEITRRFVPQLMLDDRYADAMEAALGYGVLLMARSVEKQAGRDELPADLDIANILGERPNTNWQQAERWAALFGLIPAVVRLCELAIERPDEATSTAREVVSVCRQIGGGAADPVFWASLAEIVEKALVQPIGARNYRRMTEGIDVSVSNTPKMIAMLLLSVQPGVIAEEALALHLSILPTLEQYLDRPFSAYRRILVPFITSYWTAMFQGMQLRFRYPVSRRAGTLRGDCLLHRRANQSRDTGCSAWHSDALAARDKAVARRQVLSGVARSPEDNQR